MAEPTKAPQESGDEEWLAAKTAYALTLRELTQARDEGVSAEEVDSFRFRHLLAQGHLAELQSLRARSKSR